MRKLFLLVPLLACGGPAMNSAPAVVSLQAQGASPSSISVAGGTELQFRNSDAIAHRIDSSDCPELSSPELAAGAKPHAGPFTTPNPIPLLFFNRIAPVNFLQVIEQPLRVCRDAKRPLFHFLPIDRIDAAFAHTVLYLIISQHRP